MTDLFLELNKVGAETEVALDRFLGNEEMYQKYVCDFPDEPTMGELRTSVKNKDYAAAEKAVHALKGIVMNLGFTPLADAAVDMLEELRDHDTEAALEAYADVEEQYARYCGVIGAWKNQG